jgi:hypothetical protein
MTKLILTAAIAAALGLPSIAVAQTAPASATFACRPVAAGETASGTIQNTPVLCHTLNMDKIRQAMTDAMAGLSPDQKAKVQFAMQVLRDELQLEPRYPGWDGNPND